MKVLYYVLGFGRNGVRKTEAFRGIVMKDLTKGNPYKLILLFALPVFLGCVFQQLYSMVDTVIVGTYRGLFGAGRPKVRRGR